MPDAIESLMLANLLEVFGQRDPAIRRQVIDRIFAADVVFSDPEGLVTGRDAIDGKAQAVLDAAPGFVFSPAGPAQVSNDLGYLTWNFGPEGQDPVVRGIDIGLVSDGQLSKVYTLIVG